MKNKSENRREQNDQAFTLIELLVVIAIIAVLAAMIIPIAGRVAKLKKISVAQAEIQQIESALENYKAKYGFYPPSGTNNPAINALYYELSGVTNNAPGSFKTLDFAQTISTNQLAIFGIGGLVNCSKGSGEEAVLARDFLPGLKASQIAVDSSTPPIAYLVTSVGGPDPTNVYMPVSGINGNPFRYAYPGTNNPNSYDLWVDLSFSQQTNRISNWSTRTQIIR